MQQKKKFHFPTMKVFIVLAVFSLSVLLVSGDDPDPVTIDASSPAAVSPSKKVCYTPDELTPYCPPCPPICPNINKCPCTFSDGTVIRPKPVTDKPRPPFCRACSPIRCMLKIVCIESNACTSQHIQALIDNA